MLRAINFKKTIVFFSSPVYVKNIRFFATKYATVHEEPSGPLIKTEVPGPNSQKLLQELSLIQHSSTVQFFADYDKCAGNYLVDADGNIYLDVFMQIASAPIGYNHPQLLSTFDNEKNIRTSVNRPSLGMYPPHTWPQTIRDVLLAVSPCGMDCVFPMMCGACSVETAMKIAFMKYGIKKRGSDKFTPEEIASAINNERPGVSDFSVLAFRDGFHGRTLGALGCTRSKAVYKVDYPSFDWPVAYFPKYKYPLECFEKENEQEDKKSLAEVCEKIEIYEKKKKPVVAVLIEPIQAEGGDNEGSPKFFQDLQKICKQKGVALILDEVQTGCGATGKMWCLEYFDLPSPPDIVTFSKKMLAGGVYFTKEWMPTIGYRIFNTWMGDPAKILLLGRTFKVIQNEKLLDLVNKVGEHLKCGLRGIESEFPNIMHSVRGRGTFLAFHACSGTVRDKIVTNMLKKGVVAGACGPESVRIRPALIFGIKHADIFLDVLRKTLKDLK